MLKIIDRLIEFILTQILIVLFVLAFGQVILRYIFNAPLIWSEELGRFLLVWFSFLGGTIGILRSQHITLGTSLQNYFKGKAAYVIKMSVYFFILLFLVIFTQNGVLICIRMKAVQATSFPLPMWIVFLAAPFNGFLMIFVTIVQIVKICQQAVARRN